MKNFIFAISIIFVMQLNTFASQYTPLFDKIENNLYGFKYSSENDFSRLDRIEKSIYGTIKTGDVSTRVNKLKKDISADLIGQEIEPKEDTFADYEPEPIADRNIQYPAVDELEQQLFNKTFTNKEIKQRLSQLEQKTFNRTYSDDLSTRVDRLKAQVKPKQFMQNKIAQSDNNFYAGDVEPLNKNYHLDRYESPNGFNYDSYNKKNSISSNKKLSTLEKQILKRNYINESNESRLSRLENSIFGTEFNNNTYDERIERIESAYNAQKSADKYDSNKFARNLTTAMQIGTILLMVLACIL